MNAQRQFDYDRLGNRVGVWDTAGKSPVQLQSVSLQQSGGAPTNRLTSVTNGSTTLNYTYDAAGNVTNDGAHTYTYDAENRVVSVDSGATASYGYDHQNRRIKKVIGSTTTHCVWQGSKVLAEHNGSTGAVITNYTYAGSRMINKTTSGTTSYFLSDRLSARLVLDTSGNIVGKQSHLPFGEDLNSTGTTDKHKMTSYERDTETGNDYAINRGYSSTIGRFSSVDKVSGNISRPQRLNRYSYTRNNPVNRTDSLGLDDCPDGSAWDPVRRTCVDDQTVDGGSISAGPPDDIDIDPLGGAFLGSPFEPMTIEGGPIVSGPNVEPEDQRTTEEIRKAVIDAAIDRAIQILMSSERCQALLAGKEDLFKLIDRMRKGAIKEGIAKDWKGNRLMANYYCGPSCLLGFNDGEITLDSEHFFGGDTWHFAIEKGISLAQAQAWTFLHELGHASGGLPSDMFSDEQSKKSHEAIFEACFKP